MQKVLITAGATGIGYALAKQFSDAGYQIWIIDVSKKALKECPKDWERSNIDVCDENAMSSLFKKINEKWAGLDVLCANAGTAGSTALIEDQDAEAFRKCLDVNLTGAFLSVKGSLPIMKMQKKGEQRFILKYQVMVFQEMPITSLLLHQMVMEDIGAWKQRLKMVKLIQMR